MTTATDIYFQIMRFFHTLSTGIVMEESVSGSGIVKKNTMSHHGRQYLGEESNLRFIRWFATAKQ